MTVGLREANQKFAKVVRALRAGREVTLTDRGRPLAVIRPIQAADDEQTMLARLAEEGLIIPARDLRPMPRARWQPIGLSNATETIAESVSWTRDETS